MRAEALQQHGEPPSWALERVRRYGVVVGLFPRAQHDVPFILYAQSVPRPAWSGKSDVHRETLHRVYACLITRAERQDGETVEPIIGTVDTSGGIIEATVEEDFHSLDTESGVNHASSSVCPGVQ